MRRRAPSEVDPRAHRIASLRRLIEHYGNVVPITPWHIELARLEAGEPFEVHGYQLPKLARPDGWNGRYRIERDGSLTAIGGGQW